MEINCLIVNFVRGFTIEGYDSICTILTAIDALDHDELSQDSSNSEEEPSEQVYYLKENLVNSLRNVFNASDNEIQDDDIFTLTDYCCSFNINIDLHGKNLSNLILEQYLDLSNSNLSEVDFTEAYLDGTKLTHTNLSGACFSKTKLIKVYLSNSNLTKTFFPNARLYKVNMTGINLSKVRFFNTTLSKVILDFDQLKQIDLHNANSQKIVLNHFIVSYESIYEKLYQTYKLFFYANANVIEGNLNHSDFPKEIKITQIAMMLKSMIQDVENRGGEIERIEEISSWLDNLCISIGKTVL
ncbi:MAG: pentapeptide repeat-containing protein [Neisseriaceae bacterium]